LKKVLEIFLKRGVLVLIMKCDICKGEVEETFLHKLKGCYVKVDGKQKAVCSNCQRKYKDEVKTHL
jgi:hypothetical protein